MLRRDDPLDLLLPEARAQDLRRARDVTHFLKLLASDAGGGRASTVHVDLARARGELARVDRDGLERAHVDLLRHHLRALLPAESFAWFGEPALELREAWRTLDGARDEVEGVAGVPGPGESAQRVAERLFESLARIRADERVVRLWRARHAHAVMGARDGEKLYRAALTGSATVVQPSGIARALVAGVAEALLDRGAVREARSWLYEYLHLTGADARLRQLLAWARLCAGDAAGARSVLVGVRPWSGPLPSALVDLRAARPEWLPCLAGRTPRAGEAALALGDPRDRTAFGAALLAVFAFEPRAGTRVLHHDCSPALRSRLDAWVSERDGAWSVPGEREHRVVVEARAIVEHADGNGALRGACGASLARAIAVAPFHDAEGEVAGWVHLELEHHLVPSEATLARIAGAWRESRAARVPEVEVVRESPPRWASAPGDDRLDAPLAQVFEELARAIGWKTLVRRWTGFAVKGTTLRRVAGGGDGQGLSADAFGKHRALERALATGGRVAFDEPDERLSIDARAGSGVVFPLRLDGQVLGLFAVESSRRRDFRPVDLDAAGVRVDEAAWTLRVAQFRTWHAERFGFEPWLDAQRADLRAFGRNLRAAVLVHGPAGAGKLVIARWLHFESACADGPFRVVACRSQAADPSLERVASGCERGTIVLDEIAELAPELQEALIRRFEGVDPPSAEARAAASVRWIATSREPVAACSTSGRLRADLARRLDRVALAVPPLRARREEIPSLVEHLARRFASEERLAAPTFLDEALAALWRQSWDDNVRELESAIYKLVLLHPGAEIGLRELAELRHGFGVSLARRLPSRHPDRADLVAALRTTRKLGGRANKTRAAMYLGWDPDTLVARMQDAHLGDDEFPEPAGWHARAPDASTAREVDGAGGVDDGESDGGEEREPAEA